MQDLGYREVLTLGPLLILTIYFGVYPATALDIFGPAVSGMLTQLKFASATVLTVAAQ